VPDQNGIVQPFLFSVGFQLLKVFGAQPEGNALFEIFPATPSNPTRSIFVIPKITHKNLLQRVSQSIILTPCQSNIWTKGPYYYTVRGLSPALIRGRFG
jgi:hypothetical protein